MLKNIGLLKFNHLMTYNPLLVPLVKWFTYYHRQVVARISPVSIWKANRATVTVTSTDFRIFSIFLKYLTHHKSSTCSIVVTINAVKYLAFIILWRHDWE